MRPDWMSLRWPLLAASPSLLTGADALLPWMRDRGTLHRDLGDGGWLKVGRLADSHGGTVAHLTGTFWDRCADAPLLAELDRWVRLSDGGQETVHAGPLTLPRIDWCTDQPLPTQDYCAGAQHLERYASHIAERFAAALALDPLRDLAREYHQSRAGITHYIGIAGNDAAKIRKRPWFVRVYWKFERGAVLRAEIECKRPASGETFPNTYLRTLAFCAGVLQSAPTVPMPPLSSPASDTTSRSSAVVRRAFGMLWGLDRRSGRIPSAAEVEAYHVLWDALVDEPTIRPRHPLTY